MPVFSNPQSTSHDPHNSADKCACVDGTCHDPTHKHNAEGQKRGDLIKKEQIVQKRNQRQSLTTEISNVRLWPSTTCSLYSGSRFKGEQRSGRSSYEVAVHIQHVNLAESSLCGYLHIKGLTEDYPELTTFFEAEIIGRKHSFLTKKWDANDHIDIQHWYIVKNYKLLRVLKLRAYSVLEGDRIVLAAHELNEAWRLELERRKIELEALRLE
ncbi:2250_t:CDS:2, partial [Paraglomus occultum]